MPIYNNEVQWGEDVSIEKTPVLTDEDRFILQQKMAAIDKLFEEQGKAKYKIEVFFAHTRKLHGPSVGALSLWESGSKLHGGGDAKVYLCPGKSLNKNDCESILPDHANGYGFLVCPSCQTVWKGSQVHGEVIGNWTMRTWAETIYRYFCKLGHNADVYLKYPAEDLRKAAKLEQEQQRMGEDLARVRNRRIQYIYPLKNLLKDVSNGADTLSRFYAFLTA